jgi:Na+-driven multidrug efflux pump
LQLEASGRPQLNFRIMWISVGVNLVFNLLFIPYWGIAGATFATLLATGLTIFLSKRLLGQGEGPLVGPAIKSAWNYYQLLFQNLQKSFHHVFSFR